MEYSGKWVGGVRGGTIGGWGGGQALGWGLGGLCLGRKAAQAFRKQVVSSAVGLLSA